MLDPVTKPLPPEDTPYSDTGAATITPADRKEQYAQAIDRQRYQEHQDLTAVLSTDAGQRVFMGLLDYCRPYEQLPTAEHAQMAMLEGRRRVGLHLINLVQRLDPDLYPALLVAHMKRKRDLHEIEERSMPPKAHPTL